MCATATFKIPCIYQGENELEIGLYKLKDFSGAL